MSAEVEYRTLSAKYYDETYAAAQDLTDLPFYLDLAQTIRGPVLELACGTGRILLPIARAGIAIDGVDNSPAMLSVLRRKLEEEPNHVRERISIFKGDLRSFRGQRKYALVTIPFRPLQHMFIVEDQVAALRTAAFHLQEGGLLAFDVFYPRFENFNSCIGQEFLEMEWRPQSAPGKLVQRYYRRESHDKINQNFSLTFIFRTWEGDRLIQEETEPLKMSYYTYPHLRALFMMAGLEIAEQYGSFAKTPLDNHAQQMIFLLKKSESSSATGGTGLNNL